MRRRHRIGLALGSGAARGWAHIGVIRTLEDAGIVPEIVAGSSIGAAVGAAYCAGKLDSYETFARGLDRRQVWSYFDLSFRGAAGQSFGAFAVTGAMVLAMRDEDGGFRTNPPPEEIIEPGEVLIAIGIVLIPYLIGFVPSWALAHSNKIVSNFSPELVFYLILISIGLDVIINFILLGTAVKFFMDQTRE